MTAPGRTGWFVGLLVVGWFAVTVRAAASGFFRSWGGIGPLSSVQVSLLGVPLFTGVLGATVPAVRARIATANLHLLAALQCLRILGSAHLVYWGAGIMAGSFALPVGVGNLVVAAMAVVTVVRLSEAPASGRRWLYALTLVGTAEFAMTVALAVTGFFARPTVWDPPPSPAGYMSFLDLPLVVFPTFLIPLFLSIHVVTALRLMRGPTDPQDAIP